MSTLLNLDSNTNTDTNPAASSTVAKVIPPVTQAQNDAILAAFAALHAIVWDRGEENLPTSFSSLDDKQIVAVCNRALRAMMSRKESARKAQLAEVRTAVLNVVEERQSAARAAKTAIDALPASVKAMLPAFPTTVSVSVESLQGVCGSSNIARIAQILNDLGVCKIDGRTYSKDKGAKAILIPFVPATVAATV
jgi:hypothetical protein